MDKQRVEIIYFYTNCEYRINVKFNSSILSGYESVFLLLTEHHAGLGQSLSLSSAPLSSPPSCPCFFDDKAFRRLLVADSN